MPTHTQQIKDEMQAVKLLVLAVLGWNPVDLLRFQRRMGTQYLQCYIPNDPAGIDMLVATDIFWNWWKLEWLIRDKQFLQLTQDCTPQSALSIYVNMHCPDVLIKDVYPSAEVMHRGYNKMIQELIDDKRPGA
jgi:hypothetical protein